jgi:hypothetical protein
MKNPTYGYETVDNPTSQFKNGVTTLNAGLTQALQDGANPHLYGD